MRKPARQIAEIDDVPAEHPPSGLIMVLRPRGRLDVLLDTSSPAQALRLRRSAN